MYFDFSNLYSKQTFFKMAFILNRLNFMFLILVIINGINKIFLFQMRKTIDFIQELVFIKFKKYRSRIYRTSYTHVHHYIDNTAYIVFILIKIRPLQCSCTYKQYTSIHPIINTDIIHC